LDWIVLHTNENTESVVKGRINLSALPNSRRINPISVIMCTGANQQTGVAELGAGSEPAREHIVSIPILNPISGASVSAVIEGT
jgi:hypothetical protein